MSSLRAPVIAGSVIQPMAPGATAAGPEQARRPTLATRVADDRLAELIPDDPRTPLREQDRLLPSANVARIMSNALPAHAKISRDCKQLMQECVSEFICFLSSEANDFCIAANHKAVMPTDILNALESVGALNAPRPEATA